MFGSLIPVALFVLSLASLAYLTVALLRTWRFARRLAPSGLAGPPVTVLKPLCGEEPFLYENLRSFCDQDYPVFQVVFGVRQPEDPAVRVVEAIMREFPQRDIRLVVNDRIFGGNYKASNLANMYGAAKYDWLVVADSDMRVDRTYLAAVVAPLSEPAVGVVTCLYGASPRPGVWSKLAAMFVNEWFVPSVLVARGWDALPFCFGSTMALRRDVLETVGGFPMLADHLADDYVLGALVKAQGLRVELSPYVVEHVVTESSARSLFVHELRWARTVRSVQPLGYSLSFVTYALPVTFASLVASSFGPLAAAVFVAALALRVAGHGMARRALPVTAPATPWLVPVRDAMCFVVWAASFFGRTVRWRGRALFVRPGGRLAC